jgi:hypothetical protein
VLRLLLDAFADRAELGERSATVTRRLPPVKLV